MLQPHERNRLMVIKQRLDMDGMTAYQPLPQEVRWLLAIIESLEQEVEYLRERQTDFCGYTS